MITPLSRRLFIGLALLYATPANAQSLTFRTATLQTLPSEPSAMAVGDLNNDQHPDVVVANFLDASVSIYLGGDDGLLTYVDSFPAGGAGQGIVIQDIDGDGIPDVLVSEEESDFLHLLPGLGDGTVGAPTMIFSGHDPVNIAVADFDGDGVLDLAVTLSAAGEGNGDVSILRGLGGGLFDQPQIISLGLGSEGVVANDFDGDGAPDIAVANSGPGTISLLRNLGQFNFAAPVSLTAGAGAGPLVLGDVDGDHVLDLIVANTADDTAGVLRSRGDGTFDPVVIQSTGGIQPSALVFADVNGDGFGDIVISHERSQSVSVLLGVGDGGFDAPRGFVADVGPTAVAVLDVNNDGRPDLLTANGGGITPPTLAELFGDGSGQFSGVELLATTAASGVAVADFNEDAVADAAITQPDARAIALYFGGGRSSRLVPIDREATGIATADLDGDDHVDLVAGSPSDVSILFGGSGDALFSQPIRVALDNPPGLLDIADVDHDGAPDVVVISSASPGQLTVLHNDHNRAFSPSSPVSLGTRVLSFAVIDFDGDGNPDLALGDATRVLTLRNNGDGSFAPPTSIVIGASVLALAASDVDGDGDVDLVMATSTQGQGIVRLLTNDGGGTFTIGPPRQAGQLPTALTVRDFAGAGSPALLATDRIGDAVGLLIDAGHANFQLSQTVLASLRPVGVATGDFDGDGWYDAMTVGNTICRLTTTGADPQLRGDGNGDGRVNAADLVALARELADGDGTSVDDVARGSFTASPGVDADGDGRVSRIDARALILRMMHRVPAP
ncbi:MAG TPA: FG-GAP-like repeat-containing protein [Candidatus Binatia bacterium]|nr:FG-GAP-like repeat-containing protein [Candidatus Binatia bacterium]